MKHIAVLVLSLSFFACAKSAPEPATPDAHAHEHPATTAQGAVVPPGEAKVGDKSTCPVSGEEFVVTESSPKAEHDGKTYYFCCSGCKAKFEKDPSQFTGPKP